MDLGSSATSSLISNINNLFLKDLLLSLNKTTNREESETNLTSEGDDCNEVYEEEKRKKRERKMQYILHEILETEQNYVTDLELVT